nr:MAG TPA: hypothetical protein [Caudoviricetes sp.]
MIQCLLRFWRAEACLLSYLGICKVSSTLGEFTSSIR